jgi:hypothetical protein
MLANPVQHHCTKHIELVMAATLFFKCHSLGLEAQSDAGREVFPTRVTPDNY